MRNEKKRFNFSTVITSISDYAGFIAGFIILLSGFIIVYGVVLRYFFHKPTIWEIELASYLLIAATFIAAPSALHYNKHISVDIVTENINQKWKSILYIITGFLGILFSIVMAERGYQIWIEAYENDWRSGSVWNPKLMYPYLIIPLGMIWFSLQYFVEIGERIRSISRSKDEEKNKHNDGEELS